MPRKSKAADADGTTLQGALEIIRRAMPFVDGSATVTFQVSSALIVTDFKLTNNKDSRG